MSRITILALLSAAVLSACTDVIGTPPAQPGMDPLHSNSVGFTSIGYEPF